MECVFITVRSSIYNLWSDNIFIASVFRSIKQTLVLPFENYFPISEKAMYINVGPQTPVMTT